MESVHALVLEELRCIDAFLEAQPTGKGVIEDIHPLGLDPMATSRALYMLNRVDLMLEKWGQGRLASQMESSFHPTLWDALWQRFFAFALYWRGILRGFPVHYDPPGFREILYFRWSGFGAKALSWLLPKKRRQWRYIPTKRAVSETEEVLSADPDNPFKDHGS